MAKQKQSAHSGRKRNVPLNTRDLNYISATRKIALSIFASSFGPEKGEELANEYAKICKKDYQLRKNLGLL